MNHVPEGGLMEFCLQFREMAWATTLIPSKMERTSRDLSNKKNLKSIRPLVTEWHSIKVGDLDFPIIYIGIPYVIEPWIAPKCLEIPLFFEGPPLWWSAIQWLEVGLT